MPYNVRRFGKEWKVVNTQDGTMVGNHSSKKKAKRHMRALYANVRDTGKSFNPAEHRVPGGPGGGRFAPGQVSDHQRPVTGPRGNVGGQGGGIDFPPGGSHGGGTGEGGRGDRGPSEHEESQIAAAARQELQQAHEIEQQVHMLREQIKWDRQEIAFQSGLGPPPSTQSPGVGRTSGAAGNVGSAPVPGATSGAVAQQQARTPSSTQAYIQFLQNDIHTLQGQARQLETQADALHNHAQSLMASIRGKSSIPDITITAKALQELIFSYQNSDSHLLASRSHDNL